MEKLNQETYELLLKANEDACEFITIQSGIKNWYELTYEIFKDAPLISINDFYKLIAYAYSWMPTIPDVKAHLIKNPEDLLLNLRTLKKGDLSILPSLLKELIPVINNSLTGTSKVLHFILPDRIPIIDSNVVRGWDIFFFKLYPHFEVPKFPHYKSALNSNHTARYIQYMELFNEWVANSNGSITLRDLEFGFYELGKNTIKEEKYLPIYLY